MNIYLQFGWHSHGNVISTGVIVRFIPQSAPHPFRSSSFRRRYNTDAPLMSPLIEISGEYKKPISTTVDHLPGSI